MDINDTVKVVKAEFEKNFKSGSTLVAPHRHNSVDGLQINPVDLLGYQIFVVATATNAPTDTPPSGSLRFQYDGTNMILWIRNGTTWNKVGSSGGGGTTPGGSNTNIQYNNSGAFGGSSKFNFIVSTDTVVLDKGSGPGSGGTITGGTSDLNVITNDESAGANGSGNLNLSTGPTSSGASGSLSITAGNSGDGTGNGSAGVVNITAGNGSDISGGYVFIQAGDGTGTSNNGGQIYLSTGNAGSGGAPGPVYILTDGGHAPNFAIIKAGSFGGFGGGQGEIFITNTDTAPTSNPTSGGYLYVVAGALTYRGSAGTVTTIAPA